MELPVRILFITPYPELKQQLAAIIPHYPAAKITIAEGDLGQGLIQAQRHLRPEYDAVISRGGTAELLRAAISIPVTEVEVSPYDILRALNTVGGGRAILVAHENITRSAQKLRELIDCHLEVVPLSPCSSVRDILRGLHPEGRALLCDTVAYTTALELGYHPHLVLSGDDSIRQAIDQTLLLCQARRTLSAENHFFASSCWGRSPTPLFWMTTAAWSCPPATTCPGRCWNCCGRSCPSPGLWGSAGSCAASWAASM